MMDKYKNLDPQTRKTISLAMTLLVVIVVSLIVLYLMSDSSDEAGQPTPDVPQIEDTQFNQQGLQYVEQTRDDRPSLGTATGNDNPFSSYE